MRSSLCLKWQLSRSVLVLLDATASMTLSVSTLMTLPAVHTTHLSNRKALGVGKRPCHLVHHTSLSLFKLLLPPLMPLLSRFPRVAAADAYDDE